MSDILWREVPADWPERLPSYRAFDGETPVGVVFRSVGAPDGLWEWSGWWAGPGNKGYSYSRRGAMVEMDRALESYLARTPGAKTYLPYKPETQ